MMLFVTCSDRDTIVDKSKLLGNDYRLFQQTPAWNLAKAVQDENIAEIKRIVQEEKVDVDYQESRFGHTLLMLTIKNQQYNSCKTLLELKADPNKHDNYDGSSPIIDAAEINKITGDNTEFLKLMLSHGGNPNSEEVGERKKGNSTRLTPLLLSCGNVNKIVSPIEKVKLLVEAGADINHQNEFGQSPLIEAFLLDHLDVVLYLLHKGANYKVSIINRDGKDYYLEDMLREVLLPLNSKEYKQKMEVVEFLKQKGIDYRKVQIPDFVIKEVKETYPKNWKEYLEKY